MDGGASSEEFGERRSRKEGGRSTARQGAAVMRCERARGGKTRTSTSTEEKERDATKEKGAVAAGHGRCSHRVWEWLARGVRGCIRMGHGLGCLGFAFFLSFLFYKNK
jgi:hypothetical protein